MQMAFQQGNDPPWIVGTGSRPALEAIVEVEDRFTQRHALTRHRRVNLISSAKPLVPRTDSCTPDRNLRLIAGPNMLAAQPVVHHRGAEERQIEGRLGHAE